MKLAPKRRFSQNFLTDQSTARKIVNSLNIESCDVVIEIGPGKGALTRWLSASSAALVIAVELDQRSLDFLKQQEWFDVARVRLVHGDILSYDTSQLISQFPGETIKVVGNIPYGITSDILFWLFERRATISMAVIMMQREVALRCVGRPGTKDYGILSLACWFCAIPESVLHVKAGAFFPKPEVTSSVVRFTMRDQRIEGVSFSSFMTFVRAAFSKRRKVMSNALEAWLHQQAIPNSIVSQQINGVQLTATRTEQLSPKELFALYQSLNDMSWHVHSEHGEH